MYTYMCIYLIYIYIYTYIYIYIHTHIPRWVACLRAVPPKPMPTTVSPGALATEL